MKKNDLSVFKMEKEGFKITLKKGVDFSPIPSNGHVTGQAPQSTTPHAPAATAVTEPSEQESLREITSPMVGTFYGAPSPDAAPYVTVGTEVTEDTTVCIIEAMKVMNEIKAETRGVIAEVTAESGKPVQFGQSLFKLR